MCFLYADGLGIDHIGKLVASGSGDSTVKLWGNLQGSLRSGEWLKDPEVSMVGASSEYCGWSVQTHNSPLGPTESVSYATFPFICLPFFFFLFFYVVVALYAHFLLTHLSISILRGNLYTGITLCSRPYFPSKSKFAASFPARHRPKTQKHVYVFPIFYRMLAL